MKKKKTTTEENQAVLVVFTSDFSLEWCALCRREHISCSGKKALFSALASVQCSLAAVPASLWGMQ